MLKIIASVTSELQMRHAEALAEGIRQHGEAVQINGGGTSRYVACWGWRHGLKLRTRGHEVLCIERGYLGDRFAYSSLGWNGLNGRARFYYPQDGSRFARLFAGTMKPWKNDGDYVLLMGQVAGDMSLEGKSLERWYQHVAKVYGNEGHRVVLRPHPSATSRNIWRHPRGVERLDGTLDDALAGASLVVTWNSNSATEAVMAGVPTVMCDAGGMAWPVCAHGLTAEPVRPDRVPWAERLAWCQWSNDELRDGTAWQWVGRHMR